MAGWWQSKPLRRKKMREGTPRPFSAREEKILSFVLKFVSRANVWVYRVSAGKIGGRWLRGAPVLLLTTIGRKSGKRRTTPLLYLAKGHDIVLVASKGGMSHDPLWYKNLQVNPEVEIEIGREKRQMVARTASKDEKAALWPKLVKMYRDYEDYQARTRRDIPVIILSPR